VCLCVWELLADDFNFTVGHHSVSIDDTVAIYARINGK